MQFIPKPLSTTCFFLVAALGMVEWTRFEPMTWTSVVQSHLRGTNKVEPNECPDICQPDCSEECVAAVRFLWPTKLNSRNCFLTILEYLPDLKGVVPSLNIEGGAAFQEKFMNHNHQFRTHFIPIFSKIVQMIDLQTFNEYVGSFPKIGKDDLDCVTFHQAKNQKEVPAGFPKTILGFKVDGFFLYYFRQQILDNFLWIDQAAQKVEETMFGGLSIVGQEETARSHLTKGTELHLVSTAAYKNLAEACAKAVEGRIFAEYTNLFYAANHAVRQDLMGPPFNMPLGMQPQMGLMFLKLNHPNKGYLDPQSPDYQPMQAYEHEMQNFAAWLANDPEGLKQKLNNQYQGNPMWKLLNSKRLELRLDQVYQ